MSNDFVSTTLRKLEKELAEIRPQAGEIVGEGNEQLDDLLTTAMQLGDAIGRLLDQKLDRPPCIFCAGRLLNMEVDPDNLVEWLELKNRLAEKKEEEYPGYTWDELFVRQHREDS